MAKKLLDLWKQRPYTYLMSNTNKSQIKTLNLRLNVLRAELKSELTARCGAAAKKCIREDILVVRRQLARLGA